MTTAPAPIRRPCDLCYVCIRCAPLAPHRNAPNARACDKTARSFNCNVHCARYTSVDVAAAVTTAATTAAPVTKLLSSADDCGEMFTQLHFTRKPLHYSIRNSHESNVAAAASDRVRVRYIRQCCQCSCRTSANTKEKDSEKEVAISSVGVCVFVRRVLTPFGATYAHTVFSCI